MWRDTLGITPGKQTPRQILIMWKGHCREAWDRVAALRHTMMQCGLSQPKRMPRVDELNLVRVAERDEMEDFDTFSDDMEKMILESIST